MAIILQKTFLKKNFDENDSILTLISLNFVPKDQIINIFTSIDTEDGVGSGANECQFYGHIFHHLASMS